MAEGPCLKDTVELIEKERAYGGYLAIDRFRLTHGKFEGGRTPPITREVMARGEVVGLLPYDPRADQVVLIEQFRIGAYAAGVWAWLTEIVAGVMAPGETAEEVARRETLEETGLRPARIAPIGYYLMSHRGHAPFLRRSRQPKRRRRSRSGR